MQLLSAQRNIFTLGRASIPTPVELVRPDPKTLARTRDGDPSGEPGSLLGEPKPLSPAPPPASKLSSVTAPGNGDDPAQEWCLYRALSSRGNEEAGIGPSIVATSPVGVSIGGAAEN